MKLSLMEKVKKKDILSNFLTIDYLPRWVVLCLDVFLVSLAFFASYLFAKNIFLSEHTVIVLPIFIRFIIFMAIQVFFFAIFQTYSGVLRLSGYVDATKLFLAVLSATVSFAILNFISQYFFDFQLCFYVTILFYGVSSFFLLFLLRLGAKTTFDFLSLNVGKSIPVMIFGTKSEGVAIAKLIRSSNHNKYRLVGFISTNSMYTKKVLMGVKVFDFNEENIKYKISKKAQAVIVSYEKMLEIDPKKDLDIFINNGLTVLNVPPVEVWDSDTPSIRQIKAIKIDDLLNRPQIKISTQNISAQINGKVVLITGACGSIGSEIVRQCVNFQPKLIVLLDNSETPMHELSLRLKEEYPKQTFVEFLGDVRNIDRMELAMERYQPYIVFHAAAYKHVPLVENNPTEGIQVNVLGTKNMADLSVKYNVSRFVMISTDKAVNPTNVMGASKRIAEIYVQSLNNKLLNKTKFITTRFGNVLGSNGSVIPLFKRQIKKGGPVTVTHPDIIRYFMTIPEACLLVLEAGATGKGGEIFVFDMGEPVKIADLAKRMISLAGYIPNTDIQIKYTGLREGEKLYEELLNQKEITQKTHHEKIMIAKVREYNYDEVARKIDNLIKNSYLCKNFVTVSEMKEIVPEFKSNNSIYEKLDVDTEI